MERMCCHSTDLIFDDYSFKASDITIRLGEYDFEAPSNSRRDFDVERIYMHERYNRKTYPKLSLNSFNEWYVTEIEGTRTTLPCWSWKRRQRSTTISGPFACRHLTLNWKERVLTSPVRTRCLNEMSKWAEWEANLVFSTRRVIKVGERLRTAASRARCFWRCSCQSGRIAIARGLTLKPSPISKSAPVTDRAAKILARYLQLFPKYFNLT